MKKYQIKYANGGLTVPISRSEVRQIMILRPGEIVKAKKQK